MSLADTDVEDHDETGLGDEYNDDMVDEEEDDIAVRFLFLHDIDITVIKVGIRDAFEPVAIRVK